MILHIDICPFLQQPISSASAVVECCLMETVYAAISQLKQEYLEIKGSSNETPLTLEDTLYKGVKTPSKTLDILTLSKR